MADAVAKQELLLPQHLLGRDDRVWAPEGSSTRLRSVLFSPLGYIFKAAGVQPYTVWTADGGVTNPFVATPAFAMGSYSKDGNTYLLVNYSDRLARFEGTTVTSLATGRHVPTRPSEAHRFAQVGSLCIITNGRDRNLKYDGVRISELGANFRPPAPRVVLIRATAAELGIFPSRSLLGGTDTGRARYKVSWVTHYGQESEVSAPSEAVDFISIAAGVRFVAMVFPEVSEVPDEIPDEVADTIIYRSIDEGPYLQVGRLQGPLTNSHMDWIKPGFESVDQEPAEGANQPPPIATWAFPFDGRVYYGGIAETPSHLWYSRLIDGTPAPEAVSSTNFIDVSSSDGDVLVGFALAQDYALIFKRRSIHMLTHDRARNPVISPIQSGFGAVSDRAIVQMSGQVFFLSEEGIHAFDGSRVNTLSRQMESSFRLLPKAWLKEAFAWGDPTHRRVHFAIPTGPGELPTTILTVQLDLPGIEVLPVLSYAVRLRSALWIHDRSLVCYDQGAAFDLGELFVQDAIDGNVIDSDWQTAWLHLGSPDHVKTVHKLEVYYVQRGSFTLDLDHYTDWDDRTSRGKIPIVQADPGAVVWDGGVWGIARSWDFGRVRTATVDTPGLRQFRAVAFRFNDANAYRPWALIGMRVHYTDHGVRAGALDG